MLDAQGSIASLRTQAALNQDGIDALVAVMRLERRSSDRRRPRDMIGSISRPMLRALRSFASRYGLVNGSVSLASTAKRSRRRQQVADQLDDLAGHLTEPADVPVTLPPGRARLATKPVPTGSPTLAITIGISRVACFAAVAVGV